MDPLVKIDQEIPSPKKSAEIIRVDFKGEAQGKARKRMIILYPEDEDIEERAIARRPSLAEMMAIVGGFPKRCSVIYEGQIRTMIYNGQGCCKPYHLNCQATKLRPMASFDPLMQVWGPAIILIGIRLGNL